MCAPPTLVSGIARQAQQQQRRRNPLAALAQGGNLLEARTGPSAISAVATRPAVASASALIDLSTCSIDKDPVSSSKANTQMWPPLLSSLTYMNLAVVGLNQFIRHTNIVDAPAE